MAGFCQTIQEEADPKMKEYILDYVIELLDDATNFYWASTKASQAVLLCHMEEGEFQSWLETEKIDRVCRTHAQKHSSSQGRRTENTRVYLLRLPLVHIITNVVYKGRPVKPKGYSINMFVSHAGQKMDKHIHKLNVVTIQK